MENKQINYLQELLRFLRKSASDTVKLSDCKNALEKALDETFPLGNKKS